jgi:hypothetical protein
MSALERSSEFSGMTPAEKITYRDQLRVHIEENYRPVTVAQEAFGIYLSLAEDGMTASERELIQGRPGGPAVNRLAETFDIASGGGSRGGEARDLLERDPIITEMAGQADKDVEEFINEVIGEMNPSGDWTTYAQIMGRTGATGELDQTNIDQVDRVGREIDNTASLTNIARDINVLATSQTDTGLLVRFTP